MPKIVGIHGISNQYLGSESLKRDWLTALNDGLKLAETPLVVESEFDVVFYGQLFRPDVDYKGPELTREDGFTDWDAQMIKELWKSAYLLSQLSVGFPADENREIQNPLETELKGRVPFIVQEGLRELSKTKFFKWLHSERFLFAALSQVRSFLFDPNLKSKILETVEATVSEETEILIGHSLGSIVAYEAVCAHPEWKIKTLITIGSPLGIQNLIFHHLTPKPVDGKGYYPSHINKWINIADKGDIVCLEKKLNNYFGKVEDHLVHNGWESHDIRIYLRSIVCGKAVGNALRK